MSPQTVWFLRRFGLKTDIPLITFFGLNAGMVFEGMHEHIYAYSRWILRIKVSDA